MLIFPYRVFFWIDGSVDFIARENGPDQYRFYFQKAVEPACLLRSVGFKGKHFVVISAAHEMDSALVFMVDRIHDFKQNHPAYAKTGKEFRKLMVHIPPGQQGSIQFFRRPDGISGDYTFCLRLKPTYEQKSVDILFNPYRIMLEFLKAYNHSFMPATRPEQLEVDRVWQSPLLDFSPYLNRVAWQVAGIVRKYVAFKQKSFFRLLYRVIRNDDRGIEIIGESHPSIKVWRRFKITDFYRKIKLLPGDGTLAEDSIHLELRDMNGMGGIARASLRLIQ